MPEQLARLVAIQQEIITSPLGLDDLMTLVCERTLELLPGHGTAVELLDGDEMVYRAVAGTALAVARGKRLKVSGSLSGLCVRENQTLRCDDLETDPRVDLALGRALNIRSMIVVPLVHADRAIGVLKAFAGVPNAYGPAETERLGLLAHLLSAVIGRAAEAAAKHEALRIASEREQAFRTLVFTAFEAVAVSKDGVITEANPRFLEMFGLVGQDVRGRPITSIVAPRDLAMVEGRIRARAEDFYEFTGLRADGTEIAIEGRGASLQGEAGVLRVSTMRDVTARKRAEEALRESERRSAEAAQLKSEFMANMSHEIRTPLNGVMGLADLLHSTALDEDQREFVRMIKSSADALLRLVNDILDFSKLEAQRFALEIIPFDAKMLISEVTGPLAASARLKGLALEARVEGEWPTLAGDPTRLRQVLTNLVANAIKFTAEGRVAVRARRGEATPAGVPVTIEVEDTGIGIPPAALGRMFKPFSQVDASMSRRFGGTGLGLSISRQLIEMMGGEIGVRSEEGRGSTFWFTLTLPAAAPARSRSTVAPAAPAPPPRAERPLRVLIAEDNRINQVIAVKMVERLGYQPTAVKNGLEAIEAFEREPFDLVLMDCQMPEVDGFAATRRLREGAGRSVPIVAMTANARPEDREQCLAAGMTEYISKPIDFDGLSAVIGRALAQRAGG